MRASDCRRPGRRRTQQSQATRRVVTVCTGLLSQVRLGGKWRRAQRASALSHGPSAIMRPQAIGGSTGREGEHRSRAGPSVKPALTGQAQSRERLHRASLSSSAGRKVAARAKRKCPDSRTHSNHKAAGCWRVAWASSGRGPAHRRSRHSPARHRVVNAFTGLLAQVRLGGKWRRAQRESPLNHGLSAVWDRRLSAVR